jgi:V8-like Glu-specific endopeptidase
VDDVAPIRAKEGRFLLYTQATTKGNSGSPLFFFDVTGNKALATGVHVAGLESLGTNVSVPIALHLDTQEKHFDTASNGNILYFFLDSLSNMHFH